MYGLLKSTKLLAYFKKFELAEIHLQRLVNSFKENYKGNDKDISKETK